ncbi:YybH family protein [Ramlibacter alkalitolerans]|uniref:SgcJ/EcaC family oxidoreductase n=1 Tax=Ramlibacter alkalitolerans TaxID=2039631 RepID=A0ABS1JHQ8_9BURK|nr:SgcJ/EcaC family oxidoreductase [Ramlibacter alkalitolerans]MBL0423760.1 SgcJ/EcaC family oxidoreductase [Ramlibacter alkalitolerans]
MTPDEQQIRDLVHTWMQASKAGDTATVLDLVTDDVVFLLPGRAPMRKDEFAAAAQSQAGPGAPRIEGEAEIQEVQVVGDWGFLWTRLWVKVTPPGAEAGMERSGYTLTVVRKEQGRWRLARDANLLTPVQPAD